MVSRLVFGKDIVSYKYYEMTIIMIPMISIEQEL